MVDSAIVRELTTVWRTSDTPFDARCRAIEPVIDTYLRQGSARHEGDRLGQARRLVQSAGLLGVLGPHFGAHVVRRTALALGPSSPRFVAARRLVEQLCRWPEPWRERETLWHMPAHRCRDQWALLLAAQNELDALRDLTLLWQALLTALTPPAAIAQPSGEKLTAGERVRLAAISQLWQESFGAQAADAAMYPPPPPASAGPGAFNRHARAILEIWAEVALPAEPPAITPSARSRAAMWQRVRGGLKHLSGCDAFSR